MSRHLVAPELLPALDALPPTPPLALETLAERRAMGFARPFPALTPVQEAIEERSLSIPRSGGPDVRVAVYSPPGAVSSPRPALLHIHGGGYVLGTVEMGAPGHRIRAARHDCVVVSVDYRLAPEARWPDPVEDCYVVLSWLATEAGTLGIDPARIAVLGESAGGGLAAMLALMARDRGGPAIRLLVLDAPMLDDRTGSPADADPHPHTGQFVWTPASNRLGWSALLGQEAGSAQVPMAAVPARADDLSGLPPAFIAVPSLDLFVEEDMEFARRLMRAGVPTELHVIEGGFHGFAALAPDSPQALSHAALVAAALDRAWRG